jgi:ribose transport system permease protein
LEEITLGDKTVNKLQDWSVATLWSKLGILFILVIMAILMGILSDSFLSGYNLLNILRQVSIVAILGVGMTFVILSGEIDLSVGSIVGLTSCATAGALVAGYGMFISILWGVLLGIGIGIINGFVHTYGRIPSFIVTLGMTTVARGAVLVYTQAYPITGLPDSFAFIGKGYIGRIPTQVIIMAVIFIVAGIILRYTIFGRNVYAIGGNSEAARLSGINVKINKVIIFGIMGMMAGIAGVILASRLFSGQPSAGVGLELDAIAATIIGGTSFLGGKGNVFGTLVGALIMGVLNNGLNLLGVSTYWQMIAMGTIIVLAVWFDKLKEK